MKKVFLFVLFVICTVLLFSKTNKDIKMMNSQPENAKPIQSLSKDADAINAGGMAILNLGGDMRGFTPPALTSMIIDPAANYIQVISAESDSTGFIGINYTISTDGGSNWAAPVKISPTGPFVRNYNCIDADRAAWYPSIVSCYRSASISGTWYTTDLLGPGGGSWSSPTLISDTISGYAYMPSLAVNTDGSKIAYLAYDANGYYGTNTSADYGGTWTGYIAQGTLINNLLGISVGKIIWGDSNDIYAILGCTWEEDSLRSDIANSGPGTCVSLGFSQSHDGGITYDTLIPVFNGHSLPTGYGLNGDTIIYYIDTLDNGITDYIPINAFLDVNTGSWTDELGNIFGSYVGFGTWWYWWDAEYYDGVLYIVMPIAELFFDYYDSGTKLYTFPWSGQSLAYGHMDIAGGDTVFIWNILDIHDGNILDTLGTTATWKGNAYSANLVYQNETTMYLIYLDYPDTLTGLSSIEIMNYNPDTILRSFINRIPNAGLYGVEAANIVDNLGGIHIAGISGSEDSIYYWNYNISGIADNYKSNIIRNNISFFNVPSIVKNNSEISFSISEAGNVKIALYDVTGREIKSLINGNFNAGTHSVALDGNTITQGIYFAKMITENYDNSAKIIIFK